MDITPLLDEDELIWQLVAKQAKEEEAPDCSNHDPDTEINFAKLKKWSEIIPLLESISSEKEMQTWLQSSLFCPKWLNYYWNFVLLNQLTGSIKHGNDLKTVIHTAAVSHQESTRKYTHPDPDTSDWGATDWMTQLFVQVMWDDENDIDGIFHGKHWSQAYKENLLWRIIMKVKFEHAPTQYLHGGGGYDLLAITSEEQEKFEKLRS